MNETVGQLVSGSFGEILVRQKHGQKIEIGGLFVSGKSDDYYILECFDLLYGSQIGELTKQLISGMSLEGYDNLQFYDDELSSYSLARMRAVLHVKDGKYSAPKSLPSSFSGIVPISEEHLQFLGNTSGLLVGNIRSGTKVLHFPATIDIKALTHHILVAATTGRGKSLDENEEVLIKTKNNVMIKSIGELVNFSKNFRGSKAMSMNSENFSTDFKKVIKFVKHKAPPFMYKITTESGREVTVTGDHNLYIMRDGKLVLLRTHKITKNDYAPLPLRIDISGNITELNIFDLLKDDNKIYVVLNQDIIKKLKPKNECLNILSKHYIKPTQKYNKLISNKGRIKIRILDELMQRELSRKELKSTILTDLFFSLKLKAILPITDELLQLIGYYVAEGYCLNDNSFRISCSDKKVRDNLKRILCAIGLKYFLIKKKGDNVDIGISSLLFTKIIKKFGVGNVSGNKRLPNFFMALSEKNLRSMLKTYFEGDGGVDRELNIENTRFKISAVTKSKKLASDIALALLRFGILGRIKITFKKATNTDHKGNYYYRVVISGKQNIKNFLLKVGFQFPRKNNILKNRLNYQENTNVDIIPISPVCFKQRRLKTKLSQKAFASKLNYSQQIISLIESGKRRPSRQLFNLVLLNFNNFKDLSHLANFRWDKIKKITKIRYNKKYVYDLTIKDNKTFLAGHGGLFVHNSNLVKVITASLLDNENVGMLILDPHDEYYGRNSYGFKNNKSCIYYSLNPPAGARKLVINVKSLHPSNIEMNLSEAQEQAISYYYNRCGSRWVEELMCREVDANDKAVREATVYTLRRKFEVILGITSHDNNLIADGAFSTTAGMTTISDICNEIENGKKIILDTSLMSSDLEIIVGSMVAREMLRRYKKYKMEGLLENKPLVSIVVEEAPRVLNNEALQKGNIFSTLAREGRKFQIGLIAITQLPSLIPREILANMNTKIILGTELGSERNALIESASQDLSRSDRAIASLDKGEAIITSNFTKFALPVKVPEFKGLPEDNTRRGFVGI